MSVLVASIAAFIAYRNTTRQLTHTTNLEEKRRARKHAALRSILPIELAEITRYAAETAKALDGVISNPRNKEALLHPLSLPQSFGSNITSKTIELLASFIEFSEIDVQFVENLIARIQIHDARLGELASRRGSSKRRGN